MSRITVRVPDEMKKQMDRHEEINWSEYVRKSIKERMGNPGSREIQKLVADYQSDVEKLWILHMFSYGTSKRYIYETTELLFDREMDDVVDSVESDLEEIGMENMYEEVDDGMKVRDTIHAAVASNGLSNIKERAKESIREAPREVRDGVYLLSLFLRTNLDREYTYVKIDGIERTWRIYTESEGEIDDILDLGMAYKDRRNTNAYKHWNYVIPDYAMEIIEEILRDESDLGIYNSAPSNRDLRELIEDSQVRAFLRWMGGSKKYIEKFNEQEAIEDSLKENDIDLTWNEFEEVRERLIKEDVLIIDISPHRRNAGNRRSRPARWIYKLTQPALEGIPEILFEEHLSTK